MNPVDEVLKQVENTIAWLKDRVEKGEDFSNYTAAEELERITRLQEGLLYFKQEY